MASVRSPRPARLGLSAAAAGLLLVLAAPNVDAHVLKDFGPYSVALGWAVEPTYVGSRNAVQVVVKDKQGKGVTDIGDGDLKVVVSIGGQSSAELPLVNGFDADTGLGTPGDYEAPLIPTTAGDYTFHLTGAIKGTNVDETATSSDSTFDSAVEETGIEFPNKVPSTTDIVTRLDRIDARLNAIASPGASSPAGSGGASAGASAPAPSAELDAAVTAAQATAADAQNTASTALTLGILLGGLGVILAGIALALVLRRPRSV